MKKAILVFATLGLIYGFFKVLVAISFSGANQAGVGLFYIFVCGVILVLVRVFSK